jgi:hypothetical protein
MIPENPESSSILHWLGVQYQVKTAGARHFPTGRNAKQEKSLAKSSARMAKKCMAAVLQKASPSVCVRIAKYAGIGFKFATP